MQSFLQLPSRQEVRQSYVLLDRSRGPGRVRSFFSLEFRKRIRKQIIDRASAMFDSTKNVLHKDQDIRQLFNS